MRPRATLRRPARSRRSPTAPLAAALTLLAAAPASAADGVSVTIGDRTRHFSPAALTAAADVAAGDWQPGAGAAHHPDALALRRLIELAGANPAAARRVTVSLDGGPSHALGRRQLDAPPPFGEGPPIPPLLWVDADGIHYARPVGRQLLDRIDASPGTELTVAVEGGISLRVRARASRTRLEAGEHVTLTAVVASPPAGALTYVWDLGDGRRRRGAQVRHAFDRPGRHLVVVSASGAGVSGTSAPVEIVVGRGPAPRERADEAGGSRGAGADATPPGDAGPAGGTPSTPRSRPPASAPARRTSRRAARQPTSTAAAIAGELLAGSDAPARPAVGGAASPSASGAAAVAAGGLRFADLPWEVAALVALLAGGAGIEWRLGRRGVLP